MKFEPFFKFLVDLNIFGETEFPFYDISGLCVNVNNAIKTRMQRFYVRNMARNMHYHVI